MYLILLRLSQGMAWFGGAMLSFLVLLTCVSVAGRLLNGWMQSAIEAGVMVDASQALLDLGVGPIFGDVELLESGIAFAIFAFLPLCHISGSHASVDIFTSKLPLRINRLLTATTGILFAAVMVLIAVQLWGGLQSKLRTGQTSFLIEYPVWWAYALSLSGAIVAAIVAVYLGLIRCIEAWLGRDLLRESPA